MADKEDNVELIDTGDEGKLVDENNDNNESIDNRPQTAGSVGKEEEEEQEEDTAELDEEEEYEGDEGDHEDNDIEYTNIEDNSKQKQGFFQKLKYKLGVRPKIHGSASTSGSAASSSAITVKYVPPPAPPNMPSARDAAKARIYRREKVRYGKEKMMYYLDAMRNNTLVIDDLIMKSEQNTVYVKGI